MKKTLLSGFWSFLKDPSDKGEKEGFFKPSHVFPKKKKIQVPGNWEVSGIENYSGTVWFRTELPQIELSENEDAILSFSGVDYFAKVWIDGEPVGEHEGYFQPFEFMITNHLTNSPRPAKRGEGPGVRVLIIKVSSPAEKTGRGGWPHRKRLIKGVFGHHDVRPGSWSPKYGQSHGTGGIWNDVSLLIVPRVRESGVKVSPVLKDNYRTAELNIEAFVENTTQKEAKGKLTLSVSHWIKDADKKPAPVKTVEIDVVVPPGVSVFKEKIEIRNPFLWWSWDHGEQSLYDLRAKLSAETSESETELRFGIREIKRDEKDRAWILNGRKIFVRGSNIIPEEYLSTYTPDRIQKDARLIREANCNAVRVHAHVNRKELYDALDEAGIMVWQDFPLQWEYIDTQEFIDEACRQIRDMVNLLHNNPCVVLWCCHNEPVKTGRTIDEALFKAVEEEDFTRIILRSSDFDEHPYPGWFWGHYRYFFALPGKPFPTEFGAQALPSVETLKKMFSRKELWPPDWQTWAYRDFVYEQTFHIAGVVKGKSLKEFVENSQDYQSELIKYAVERYRQHKGSEISGIFHFMLLEPWPAVSYSVTDYFRNRKKGYYILQKCFQPVLVISSLQRKIYGLGHKIEGQFWIVNDHFRDFDGARIEISLRCGKKVLHKYNSVMINIGRDACKEVTNIVYSDTKGLVIPKGIKPGPCELVLEVYDAFSSRLSANTEELVLEKIPKEIVQFNAEFVWE